MALSVSGVLRDASSQINVSRDAAVLSGVVQRCRGLRPSLRAIPFGLVAKLCIILVFLARPARGQISSEIPPEWTSCDAATQELPVAPANSSLTCEDDRRSRCWYDLMGPRRLWHGTSDQLHDAFDVEPIIWPTADSNNVIHWPQTAGFPLHINLRFVHLPGDFLPPAPDLGSSSAALVPTVAKSLSTSWQGLTRPTLDGAVDLVTGVPLTQVEDLSLPLDGATFRLIRTRSQNTQLSQPEDYWDGKRTRQWWDWAGLGWMTSENPLLVFESTLADVVGNNPRTSWLILDAHHSIPFQLIESSGLFVAPPRFRARMSHDGVWNPTNRTWSTFPKNAQVSLYEGLLTYSFNISESDIPDHKYNQNWMRTGAPAHLINSSYHSRPFLPQQLPDHDERRPYVKPTDTVDVQPGLGIPYLGICTQITDKYNHRIEIQHLDATHGTSDYEPTTGCKECTQKCYAKGAIKAIRIFGRGATGEEVKWTLVYFTRVVARSIPDPNTTPFGDWQRTLWNEAGLYGTATVDSIYVYDRDVNINSISPDDLIIEPTRRMQLSGQTPGFSLDGGEDALDHFRENAMPVSSRELLDGYKYVVRYHYHYDEQDHVDSGGRNSQGLVTFPPILAKATTTEFAATSSSSIAPVSRRQKVYVYSADGHNVEQRNYVHYGDAAVDLAWLVASFDDEGLDAIKKEFPGDASVDANWVAQGRFLNSNVIDGFGKVMRHSTVQYESASNANEWGGGSSRVPDAASLVTALPNNSGQYISLDVPMDRLALEPTNGLVGRAAIGRGKAGERFYQMYRFMSVPTIVGDVGTGPSSALVTQWDAAALPHRSIYVNPYAWRGYPRVREAPETSQSDEVASPPGDRLKMAQWINVIDEFDTYDSMTDINQTYGFGGYSIKKGMLSRRVVSINASGVVLRDYKWDFSKSGAVMTGSGLGEQYVYARVPQVFATPPSDSGVNNWDRPAPATVQDTNVDPPTEATQPSDPLAGIRDELLLIEHRSVGWSAANAANVGNTDGLTHFFEYDLNTYRSSAGENPPATVNYQVDLTAEGIKRGQAYKTDAAGVLHNAIDGGPRLYTVQHFHLKSETVEGVPAERVVDVNFLTPAQVRLSVCPAIPTLTTGWDGSTAVTHTITLKKPNAAGENAPFDELRASSRLVIGSPKQLRPAAAGSSIRWYYPVEREFYNETGSPNWSATGLVRDPLIPSNGSDDQCALSLTYYQRDGSGRSLHTVMDAVPDSNPTYFQVGAMPTLHVPQTGDANQPLPATWTRIPGSPTTSPVPGYVTTFKYNNPNDAVSDIYFPNHSRWASRIIIIKRKQNSQGNPIRLTSDPDYNKPLDESQEFAREFVFNQIVESGSNLESHALGEVKDYAGKEPNGRPIRTRKVTFPGVLPSFAGDVTFVESSQPVWTELAQVELQPDANGRMSVANLLEANDAGALVQAGSKEVNDLTDFIREREIDGQISIRTRNTIGQVLREYTGTRDGRFTLAGDDNMILTSRIEYGTSTNDAWLPTVTRKYLSRPSWDSANSDPFAPLSGTDTDGIATVTQYDWRMRPVRTDSFQKGSPATAPRVSTTLTYLDHLDRPTLQVSFGAGTLPSLGNLDPTKILDGDPRPAAAAFYSLALRPTSITETVYGADGSAVQHLNYDVAWTPTAGGTPPYQVDMTFTGRGGVPVFTQHAAGVTQITKLDGVGRVISSASVAPGRSTGTDPYLYELSRTDTVYDTDGNVIETKMWERTVDTDNVLSASNAVCSKTWNWYDDQKRLIATANVGRGPSAKYTNGGDVENLRPDDPPTVIISDGNGTAVVSRPSSWTSQLADVPVTLYVYNTQGQRTHVVSPARVWSGGAWHHAYERTIYDNAGRMRQKREYPCDSSRYDASRNTTYGYQLGKLHAMTVNRVADQAHEGAQQTEVWYDETLPNGTPTPSRLGAEVLDTNFEKQSESYELVRLLVMPDVKFGTVGDPSASYNSAQGHIRLRYTFDGQIAERIDARGVAFRYRYDDARRLASIEIGSYVLPNDSGVKFSPGYPSSMTTSLGAPVDRIGFVEYSYDDAGRLSGVITRDRRLTTGSNPQPGRVITQNTFDYDTRSDLLREWQSLGALVGVNTPKVEYAWQYAPSATDLGATPGATGRHRLTSMHYPQHLGVGGGRTVTFGYGDANSVDELLSRLTFMDTLGAPKLAQFTYSGVARRQQLKYAQGSVTQSLLESGQTGLARLDGLGRIADLKFANSAGTVLFESKYTFDSSGNRRSAQVTQAPVGGVVNQNRSVVNTYDGFQRLSGSEMGQLDLSNPTSPSIVTSTSVRSDIWNLDLLGNWVGGIESGQPANTPGRRTFGDLDHLAAPWYPVASDATPDEITQVMAVNFQNSVFKVNETRDFDSAPRQLLPRYDAAGSMTFDGEYFYQYDAWNRVVQINKASLASPANPDSAIVFGPMVKHYTYDGVGRLVRTQSPWPNPDQGGDNVRTERFFYDGIRRIQELVTDPVQNLSAASMSSSASVQQAAATAVAVSDEELDASAAPASVEAAQAAESTPINITTLAREYVWGPGDNGIDELFAQFDESSKPWWIIQDTGGDIVAVVEVPNANLVPSSTNLARVAAQWSYDAYGSVVSAEHLYPHPLMHCGHKGMFFDRLDVGVIDLVSNSEIPRLIPFSHAVYHNRNRLYNPQFGRFMQQDPNATAMALLEGSHSGRGVVAVAMAFSTEERYGDGYNLYQYLASNPWNRSDPMGLSSDPFDMVDAYLAEDAGSKAAFMGQIVSGARSAAYIASYIASILPFPAPSLAGSLAMTMIGEPDELANSEAWAAAKTVGNAINTAIALKFMGQATIAFFRTAKSYASTFGAVGFRAGFAKFAAKSWQTLKGAIAGPDACVYLGIREHAAVYVGITNDISVRNRRHGNRFDKTLRITPYLKRILALGIETAIILSNPQFENMKNSISASDAIAAGISWVIDIGFSHPSLPSSARNALHFGDIYFP